MSYLQKPAVSRRVLLILSGLMWSGVGILLNSFAFRWLKMYEGWPLAASILAGLLLGSIIAWFGFSKVAATNIRRIQGMPARCCVFAFQRWQSYILIAVMMSMGIFLRHTTLVPRLYLASLYIGIGSALFMAGLGYYRVKA